MRPFRVLYTLLLTLLCGLPCQAQTAGEVYFEEASRDTWTPDTLQGDAWGIEAPNPAHHAGLLGKMYMQQRYLYLGIDDPDVSQIDDSLQGFDTFVNLPLMTLDLPVQLDFDLFFGYATMGLKGSATTGPPLDILVTVNGRSENYSVGTSIYLTQAERWRPFVQIGAEYSRADEDIILTDTVDTFAANFVDSQTDLLLNAGFEYDFLDVLGYRMTIDFETRDRLRDSTISNELILWPHEKVYIRGGLATSLEGGGLGFALGGGLAF